MGQPGGDDRFISAGAVLYRMERKVGMALEERCWTQEQVIVRGQLFPGSWIHSGEVICSLPRALRPYYRVNYRSVNELNVAKSVEPPCSDVEYIYVGPIPQRDRA